MEEVEEEVSGPVSVDYYYLKALSYLTSSGEGASDDGCSHCPSPEDKDDHFSMDFRPGLALDGVHGSHGGLTSAGSSSCTGSDVASSHSASSSSSSERVRERKFSLGCRAMKTGSSDLGQPPVRRKMSDGHVHWADEFRKDLTRCHPRKTYSRHPSHSTTQVKPILKPNSDDTDLYKDCEFS